MIAIHETRISPGDLIPIRDLLTISGKRIGIPTSDRLIHLQFRRFAGCPVCDLHLYSIMQRHGEILAASIREVVVFHSTSEELSRYAGHLPFDVIADPGKRLYAQFGVERDCRALLDPRAWRPISIGVCRSFLRVLRREQPLPRVRPDGGSFGLPADFLIAGGGRVLACKYGSHAYDQWTVDEILEFADTRGSISQSESPANVNT